jgi:anti-sigma B factor antagonist
MTQPAGKEAALVEGPGVGIAVHREDHRVVMDVTGEVDVIGAAELDGVMRDVVAEGAADVVIDLADVTFIDSTGLSALVAGRNLCRSRDGDLTLRAPSPQVWRVLTLTGLDTIFAVDQDL